MNQHGTIRPAESPITCHATVERHDDWGRLSLSGSFDLDNTSSIESELNSVEQDLERCTDVDSSLKGLEHIDGAGAVFLARLIERFETVVQDAIWSWSSPPDRYLDAKLAETLKAIDVQRIATVDVLQDERVILLEELNRQLEAGLASLERERTLLMSDVGALTAQSIEQGSQETKQLIDHLSWRVLQLLLIAVVLFTLSSMVIRRVFGERRHSGQ